MLTDQFQPLTLVLYAVLGALTGVAAAGFIRALHWLEDGFDLIPGRYIRHLLGMLLVGILIYVLWIKGSKPGTTTSRVLATRGRTRSAMGRAEAMAILMRRMLTRTKRLASAISAGSCCR